MHKRLLCLNVPLGSRTLLSDESFKYLINETSKLYLPNENYLELNFIG
jgi:hypothetical protein